MKVGKPKSKRTPTRLRHKIEKASAAKQRKARKEAKKNPQWRSRLKKDPGIPNLFPFKDRMLAEVEEGRRRKIEERDRRRDEARNRRVGGPVDENNAPAAQLDQDAELLDMAEYSDEEEQADADGDAAMMVDANPMAALLASARARAHDYDAEALDSAGSDGSDDDGVPASEDAAAPHAQAHTTTPQSQARAQEELIAASDTILYILDARDPTASLSRALVQRITSDPAKRLELVLNKADLAPAAATQSWLRHLGTKHTAHALSATASKSTADEWSASALLKALKAQSKSRGLRTHTIGLLGARHAGKSATATALAHAAGRASRAIANAGRDAGARRVKLDGSTSVLDGPGGAAAPAGGRLGARLTLLGAQDGDAEGAVAELVRRLDIDGGNASTASNSSTSAGAATLSAAYGGPAVASVPEALVAVARARGRLGRGGVPNLRAAALTVLADWREGRLGVGGGVAAPSAAASSSAAASGRADERSVVGALADEFRIEGLWNDGVPGGGGGAEVEMEVVE